MSKNRALEVDFGELAAIQPPTPPQLERHLYYCLINVDEHYEVLPVAFDYLQSAIDRTGTVENSPESGTALVSSTTDLAISTRLKIDRLVPTGGLTDAQRTYLWEQMAPMGLIDGCLLQNASIAATSESPVTAELLGLYAHELGDSDPARTHANLYSDLLHASGIYLPTKTTWAFVQSVKLLDSAFTLPVLTLCLAQYPRRSLPELLGYNLYAYVAGFYPLDGVLGAALIQEPRPKFVSLHSEQHVERAKLVDSALRAVELHLGTSSQPEEVMQRVWNGIHLANRAHFNWLESILRPRCIAEPSSHQRMVDLVSSKASWACGYHEMKKLGGKQIDDLLDPEGGDVELLVECLAKSVWVKPGDATGSRFFTELVQFGGPMFRIFSPGQLDVIRDWVDELSARREPRGELQRCPMSDPTAHATPSPARGNLEQIIRAAREKYASMSYGDLYYHLINVEFFPDALLYARHFAAEWLKRAAKGLYKGEFPLPFTRYSPDGLDGWVHDRHRWQVESYRPLEGEPSLTEGLLIEQTTQLAPMILIDGAWVENMSNAGSAGSRIGSLLFNIYSDEVGNGRTELNHPTIFRDLLRQMGVELPATDSLEFARWWGFQSTAFEVPVFWLAISRFPRLFKPEILGLNLAMEISGIGGSYRESIDTLRYYGYSSYFVDLHNVIDNASTGHTAMAREAIKLHMDGVAQEGGASLMHAHWERVWTGFLALKPQGLRQGRSRMFRRRRSTEPSAAMM